MSRYIFVSGFSRATIAFVLGTIESVSENLRSSGF